MKEVSYTHQKNPIKQVLDKKKGDVKEKSVELTISLLQQ